MATYRNLGVRIACVCASIVLCGAVVLGVLAEEGCGAVPLVPQSVTNAVALEGCVQDHWGQSFAQVVLACAPDEEALVADAIAVIVALGTEQSDAGVPNPYADEPHVQAALARRMGQ